MSREWTTPRTWSENDVITAKRMEDIKNNISYLYDRSSYRDSSKVLVCTASRQSFTARGRIKWDHINDIQSLTGGGSDTIMKSWFTDTDKSIISIPQGIWLASYRFNYSSAKGLKCTMSINFFNQTRFTAWNSINNSVPYTDELKFTVASVPTDTFTHFEGYDVAKFDDRTGISLYVQPIDTNATTWVGLTHSDNPILNESRDIIMTLERV